MLLIGGFMSKVSIVVPIYNAEKYLEKCIKSILGQTFLDIEIILINDGSNDKSLSICEKYAKNNSKIIIINKKNQGCIATRRVGIIKSKSKYITFVDADDWISENAIEVLYRSIEESQSDISVCNFKKVLGKSGIIKINNKSRYFNENNIYEGEEIKNKLVEVWLHGHPFPASLCGKLYKKDYLVNSGKYLERINFLGEDLFYNMEIFLKVKKVNIVKEPLYYYRTGGITSKFMPNMFSDMINGYKIQREVIEEYYESSREKRYNGISIMLINTFKTCMKNMFMSQLNELEIKKNIELYINEEIIIEAINNSGAKKYFESEFLEAIKYINIEYLYNWAYKAYKKSRGRRTLIKIMSNI